MDTARPDASVDPRLARVAARDRTADGLFWYSVTTTGVYCRPSCFSRRARPENIRLHETLAEARASGARPCLRCDPEGLSEAEVNAARVQQACRRIAASETPPTLAQLADAAELSPRHFHRMFKAATGSTPRAYAAALRAQTAREALTRSRSVAEAAYAAGYGSSSRFYEHAPAMLGMAPARYRNGGVRERLRFAVGRCALGEVLVASSAAGVAAILLGDDAEALLRELQDRFASAELVGADPQYESVVARVVALVDRGEALDLPLDVRGTLFQRRVWEALRGLRSGEVLSYGELAARIAAPAAVRAVASACAANAHAVAIPCHRVVRRDGGLSGYRWGVERKRALLDREARDGGPEAAAGAGAEPELSPSPPACPSGTGSGRPRR